MTTSTPAPFATGFDAVRAVQNALAATGPFAPASLLTAEGTLRVGAASLTAYLCGGGWLFEIDGACGLIRSYSLEETVQALA